LLLLATERRSVPGLAAGYAALALLHLPSCLVFAVVPVAYAAWGEGIRAAARAVGAGLVGACLAAFYLVPAVMNRPFIAGQYFPEGRFDYRQNFSHPDAILAALRAAGVPRVTAFRAPEWSINDRSLWALDVLVSEGYRYDSSIYPIRHDRYGIPGWQRHIHQVTRHDGALWELPGSTIRLCGANLPIGGGGYFRLLPYGWTRNGFRRLNDVEKRPGIFYIHPWEIDPGQPRINVGALSRVRHYHNLHKTEARLKRLLDEFKFGSVSDVLAAHQHQAVA
jgi:hypothetical protein